MKEDFSKFSKDDLLRLLHGVLQEKEMFPNIDSFGAYSLSEMRVIMCRIHELVRENFRYEVDLRKYMEENTVCRPYDEDGKIDGARYYIHRTKVAELVFQIRKKGK